jgi:membrane protein DedA with SNARE-associated domain
MDSVANLIARHGPLLVGGFCFVEAIGLPLPAAVALLGAGALSYQGVVSTPAAFLSALAGLLAGDALLFAVGRFTGWYFLGLLCRLSANPESCIHNAAQRFYRSGRTALLFTKFIPGINTMAAPLAGSLHMRPSQFFAFDTAGALIYAGTYFGLGYLFSDFLGAIVQRMQSAGEFAHIVLLAVAASYMIYRAVLAWRLRASFFDVPRMTAAEAARAMTEEDGDSLVMDVRSHGYYAANAMRIQGATRLEPNRLTQALHELPEAKKIYLYCT